MVELLAFTANQVKSLTGLSDAQLRYWDKTEFFRPQYATGFRAFGRIYSFRDLVGLRAIAVLRKQYGVSLQELRVVGERFTRLPHVPTPWASLKLWVLGKKVYFTDPETGRVVSTSPAGQTAIVVALDEIAQDMGNAAQRLRERRDEQIGRVERNRYLLHNAFVISGTRVPTEAVWNFHEAGYDTDAIIREYPRLTVEDVRQAVRFETERRVKRTA